MASSAPNTPTGFASDPAAPAKHRRVILVVDDEQDSLDFVRSFLSGEGFDVVPASNGAEALALLGHRKPDLVILDLMMPGMNGFELCNRLRSRTDTHSVPIIVYSAYELRHASQGLYDHAFVKPTDPDMILWTIRALLPEVA